MSAFDFKASLESARHRLRSESTKAGRRPRSDRGASRLDPRVLACLVEVVSTQERPPMTEMLKQLAKRCQHEQVQPPARATVYKLLDALPTPTWRLDTLPPAVRDALYNLGSASEVPGHQLAFYCFNYGDLTAVSFAAGLPWLALHQARRLPGYRPRSRGLLEAVARVRGI